MKSKLGNLITALRIAEQLPTCDLKDERLDDLFDDVSKLGIEVDDVTSAGDYIRCREFTVANSEQGIDVWVRVIQSPGDELITIEAYFGDEK